MRLVQFFTHDLFDQNLDGTYGKATYILTKVFEALAGQVRMTPVLNLQGRVLVGFFLDTGITLSLW